MFRFEDKTASCLRRDIFGSASQSTIDVHYTQVCKGYNLPSRTLVNNCVQEEIAEAKAKAGIKEK